MSETTPREPYRRRFRAAVALRQLAVVAPLLLLGLFSTACSLIEGPPQPVIPDAAATGEIPSSAEQIVFEEVGEPTPAAGSVAFAVDPDIAALLNGISRQNLFAYVRRLESFGTRHALSTADNENIGVGAARRWLFDELKRVGGERLEVAFDEFTLDYGGQTTQQQNVVATLPGTGDYSGTIIVSAHYDSRAVDVGDGQSPAPGANDNASGVALLLEAARLLSAREWAQTIVFVAFAAEEQGTYGSGHFVQSVMLDGMIIDAVVNNDIVGGRGGIPASVRVFAPGPESSASIQLARYLSAIADLYSPMFAVDIQQAPDRAERFGDQREFQQVGVPAVRLTESLEDFSAQHNVEDTSDKIDYEYLVQVTRLNVAAVANMAGAPPTPPTPTIAPMAEEGSYLLTWPTDPRAAGYAVVAREIGSVESQFRFVGASEAGNVVITGFTPGTTYNISLAALDDRGRMSLFSPETLMAVTTPEEGEIDAGDAITDTQGN